MTIAAFVALLTAFAKAAPIFDKWIEEVVAAYVLQKKRWIKKENKEAIERALKNDDQIPIEEQMGSSTAGRPSGEEGAVIVDSLPGVLRFEKRNSGKHLAE